MQSVAIVTGMKQQKLQTRKFLSNSWDIVVENVCVEKYIEQLQQFINIEDNNYCKNYAGHQSVRYSTIFLMKYVSVSVLIKNNINR